MDDSPGERPGQPRRSLPVFSWERGGNARGAIAVLGLSPPKVIEFAPEAFGRLARFALSGARDDSECRSIQRYRLICSFPVRRLRRKQAPSHGGLTRAGAEPGGRAPESGGRTDAGRFSCCGAVAAAVVTARRAGTRSRKPRTVSTRELDTLAQPGEWSESERSERPGEQDCRARATGERARRVWCGGRWR